MRRTPRLLAQTSLLVLIPALALAGCQAPLPTGGAPGAQPAAANAGARGTVVLQLGDRAAAQRSVLGLGFADTAIAAARVTVMGADMILESKTVAWNGADPLNVSLNVPAGNVRLFKIEALDADPATATSEPNVRASIRAVADVAAGGALTIDLNYNTDAIGRVVEALQTGLSHGFDKTVHGELATPSGALKDQLLTALTSATFTADLTAFVNQVTQYAAPTMAAPNGSYAGVHPLYFNADHMVGLMLAEGPTVVTTAPPLPLEAFRAVGQVRVQVGAGNTNFFDPDELELVLQVPFTSFKDGGLFHQDVARPVSLSPVYGAYGTSAVATFELRDVPPGEWGLVARYKGAVVGSGRVKVGHGAVEAAIAVAPPALADVQGAVFDEFGDPIEGATVTVTSLDATKPFTGTAATTATGAYKVEGAPAEVQLRVSATKAGHTTREQVATLGPGGLGPVGQGVNFGSDGGVYGVSGQAFFLSDRPEVVSVQPDAARLAAGGLGFRLAFSEPLDAANRAKVERSIDVQFNTAAVGAFLDRESTFGIDDPMAPAPIAPTLVWDASNDAVTFAIDAPALRYDDDYFAYHVRLKRLPTDTVITDGNGRRLGFEEPAPGAFYAAPFKVGNIGRATFGAGLDAFDLWDATHRMSGTFELAPDVVAPHLLSAAVPDLDEIHLTFDEPMVAFAPVDFFPGDRRYIDNGFGPSLRAQAFTFVVGANAGAVAAVAMDGTSEAQVLPGQPIPLGVEFSFEADAFGNTAFRGYFDPASPETIVLGSSSFTQLPAGPGAIKVRVREGAEDPAGNAVAPAGATVTATF